MPAGHARKRTVAAGRGTAQLFHVEHAMTESVKSAALAGVELLTAGIEWLTASIKLKQAKAEADRLGLIEKINAAIEPPTD